MNSVKSFLILLSCFSINANAADEIIHTEAGSFKANTGSSLTAGQGTGLVSSGSSLNATVSGLNAEESDLGTAIHLAADVLFDFDKADLKPEAGPILEKVVTMIGQKKPMQVQIHGYTDSKGSDDYNQTLSQQRAQAVAGWFKARGIPGELLVTAGFGETNPVAPNEKPDGSDNPEGRQQNRRVDIMLNKAFSPIAPFKPEINH